MEKDELASIKMELKCWESMFARKYKRKPTKEDIDQSTPEVQDSYKRYAKLKSVNSGKTPVKSKEEQSDGVFGSDLNKKKIKSPVEKKSFIKHDENNSWRPKLKVFKRHSPKNATPEEICSSTNTEAPNADIKDKENDKSVKEIALPVIPNYVIASNNKLKPTLPTSRKLGGNKRNNRHSLLRTAKDNSIDWLESCKQSLEIKNQNNTKTSNDIATNSICNTNAGNKIEQTIENCEPSICLKSDSQDNTYSINEIVAGKHIANKSLQKEINETAPIQTNLTDKSSNISGAGKGSEIDFDETLKSVHQVPDDIKTATKQQQPNRKSTKNDSDDIAVESEGNKTAATRKRKRVAGKNTDDAVESDTKKIKVSKKAAASKGKRLVSENFVKIDLRKKTYVRGLKKVSVACQKRRAWRSKTSFELPSKTGKKICFKCGGEGHWAKFCRGRPKQVDLFKKLDEEKGSLEYKSLADLKGSCFDQIYNDGSGVDDAPSFMDAPKKFTMDDVLDIKPCWPRTPYITENNVEPVKPLIEPVNDLNRPSEDAYSTAKNALKNFGFDSFREGQQEATARILSGLSTLVILATGSGKSLCYQLPAYLYYKEKGWMTLVVSPLVALMQDQVAGLPDCLPGAALNSNMTKLQQQKVITNLKEGKIAILLVSPEALVSGGFGTGILPPKSSLPPIGFACIDEAHCLSEWSHNFRPSYLKVCKVLRERYRIGCLLGLTATASTKTAKSVIQHLGVPDEGSIIRDPNPIPDNLQLTASRDENRDAALVELLQNKPFDTCDSIIVYVTRRNDCDRLAVLMRTSLPEFVKKEKTEKEKEEDATKKKKVIKTRARKKDADKPSWWNCEAYHAGLTPAQRKHVQNQFMAGELRIVVATVAFGMGLDKSDVRSVIHYNMPKSFENYVQEIGRAGRDGKPSFCHVFLEDDVTDLCELKRHIYGDSIDRSVINRFVDLLFPPCDCQQQQKQQQQQQQQSNEENNQNILRQQNLNANELESMFAEEFDFIPPGSTASRDNEESDGASSSGIVMSQTSDIEMEKTDNECSADEEEEHMSSENEEIEYEDPPIIPKEGTENKNELELKGEEADRSSPKASSNFFAGEDKDSHIRVGEKNSCSEKPQLPLSSTSIACDIDKDADKARDSSQEIKEKCANSLFQNDKLAESVIETHNKKVPQTSQKEQNKDVSTDGGAMSEDGDVTSKEAFYCSGHRRSMVSDKTISDLDVREEVISTLLAYLELHPKTWLRMLNPLRSNCVVKCYGGPVQFQMLAKKFPPVAIALRYILPEAETKRNLHERRQIEFDFVRVADTMCWDILTVLRELKALQWNMAFALDSKLNTTGKSGIIVETDNLSFHFTTASNVDDDSKDEICDFLHGTIMDQEETRLLQLDALYCVLKELSCKTYDRIPTDRRIDAKAREHIGQFFLCQEEQHKPFLKGLITSDLEIDTSSRRWNIIAGDIRNLVNSYPEIDFNGRSVARIFQGIESPRFPAIVYGRDRRFWRQYLDVDFNGLRKFAVRELSRT